MINNFNIQSGLVYRDIRDTSIETLDRSPYPHYWKATRRVNQLRWYSGDRGWLDGPIKCFPQTSLIRWEPLLRPDKRVPTVFEKIFCEKVMFWLRWVSSPGPFDCQSNALSSEVQRFNTTFLIQNLFTPHPATGIPGTNYYNLFPIISVDYVGHEKSVSIHRDDETL